MRPGQQNKRGRGRVSNNNGGGNNNFNRKGGNSLTRTYDSSGPDVKIRGTVQHIAEKYAALARDAQSSGDRIMAENYLQHAEHYNRIIVLAQAQMQERYQRDDRSEYNVDGDDIDANDRDEGVVVLSVQRPEHQEECAQRQKQPERQECAERQDHRERSERQPQAAESELQPPIYDASSAPQPIIEGTPLEVTVEEEQQQAEAPAVPATERAGMARRAVGPRRLRRGAAVEEDAEGEETSADDEVVPPISENAAE